MTREDYKRLAIAVGEGDPKDALHDALIEGGFPHLADHLQRMSMRRTDGWECCYENGCVVFLACIGVNKEGQPTASMQWYEDWCENRHC